jgi:hypothetical protein
VLCFFAFLIVLLSLVGGRAKNKSNPLPLRNKHFLSVNQFVMTIVEFVQQGLQSWSKIALFE